MTPTRPPEGVRWVKQRQPETEANRAAIEAAAREIISAVRDGGQGARFGDGYPVQPEGKFEIGVELDHAHLFDAESGLNLEIESAVQSAAVAAG